MANLLNMLLFTKENKSKDVFIIFKNPFFQSIRIFTKWNLNWYQNFLPLEINPKL